uniref:Ground-like domain-containing protein n=1 Tax=Caenorhabditis tropicalis TaxID=1561998 RepID=A0A1I7TFK4_9PELO
MFKASLFFVFSSSYVFSAIIPLPSPPNPIPEPPTVDASPSLTSEKRAPTALEVTSSAHHLPRKETEQKVSRNRVRLHSHNSKISKLSRTREVEILNEKCNDDKLQQIMQDAMTPSLSTSKMVISERATRDFGANFDVICARGHFSYYVETTSYCEVTLYDITCLAYQPTPFSDPDTNSGDSLSDIVNIKEQLIKNRNAEEKEEDEAKLNR